MKKIISDSGCDIRKELAKEIGLNLELIPLNLQIGDEHFIDDETLDINYYLEKMVGSSTPPKTSAPSPELYAKSMEDTDSAFVLTLSSKLSGSYNSANLGKDLALEKDPSKFIHVIDSKTAAAGQNSITLKLGELIASNLSNNEIVEKITEFIDNMRTYVILEKYDNLVKTGRLNPAIAKVASIMSLKPLCKAIDGEIQMIDKARGYQRTLKKLVDLILEDKLDFENRILSISHVKCYEKALETKEAILNKVTFKDVVITDTTGLCSTYANIEGIVVSF